MMSNSVHIRAATLSDVRSIVALWKEFMDFHAACDKTFQRAEEGHVHFESLVQKRIELPTEHVLVADYESKVVGYCVCELSERNEVYQDRRHGVIQALAVTANCRRTGIGSKLLAGARAWFRAKGVRRLEVPLASRNDMAKAFWHKHGFERYLETLCHDT
jgi:ribosomal protein S18 acetylase RimI-like enzyme